MFQFSDFPSENSLLTVKTIVSPSVPRSGLSPSKVGTVAEYIKGGHGAATLIFARVMNQERALAGSLLARKNKSILLMEENWKNMFVDALLPLSPPKN